ncbi:hypothetical protein [Nonomuraea sp. NPDC003804]|uniref:hypothetical protein n=1 Tax=Nonomuraea sp. NPDC003804 TaxID=3154547 RepID=UPI0033A0B724
MGTPVTVFSTADRCADGEPAHEGDRVRDIAVPDADLLAATHRCHYVVLLNGSGVIYALLGRITITEDRDRTGNVDGFPVSMVARRSTDAGAGWHDFPITVDVPPNSRRVVVDGKPIKHDGAWLLPYWRWTCGGTRAGVLRSTGPRT